MGLQISAGFHIYGRLHLIIINTFLRQTLPFPFTLVHGEHQNIMFSLIPYFYLTLFLLTFNILNSAYLSACLNVLLFIFCWDSRNMMRWLLSRRICSALCLWCTTSQWSIGLFIYLHSGLSFTSHNVVHSNKAVAPFVCYCFTAGSALVMCCAMVALCFLKHTSFVITMNNYINSSGA